MKWNYPLLKSGNGEKKNSNDENLVHNFPKEDGKSEVLMVSMSHGVQLNVHDVQGDSTNEHDVHDSVHNMKGLRTKAHYVQRVTHVVHVGYGLNFCRPIGHGYRGWGLITWFSL